MIFYSFTSLPQEILEYYFPYQKIDLFSSNGDKKIYIEEKYTIELDKILQKQFPSLKNSNGFSKIKINYSSSQTT